MTLTEILGLGTLPAGVSLLFQVLGIVGWIGWIVSEIMALSNCEYNGVLHFVIRKCDCLGGRQIHVEITIRDIEIESVDHIIVV